MFARMKEGTDKEAGVIFESEVLKQCVLKFNALLVV